MGVLVLLYIITVVFGSSEFQDIYDLVKLKMHQHAPRQLRGDPNSDWYFCRQGAAGHQGVQGYYGYDDMQLEHMKNNAVGIAGPGYFDNKTIIIEYDLDHEITAYECDVYKAHLRVLDMLDKFKVIDPNLHQGMPGGFWVTR